MPARVQAPPLQLPLPPAANSTASAANIANAAPSAAVPPASAVAGYRIPAAPVVQDPLPAVELNLRAACARFNAGELFLLAGQRARVRARSTRLTKFSVDDEGYKVEVGLTESSSSSGGGGGGVDGGVDNFTIELPLSAELIPLLEGLLGHSLTAMQAKLHSEDKAVCKLAKAGVKAANAHFVDLEGDFVLGGGPSGLAVHGLPERDIS